VKEKKKIKSKLQNKNILLVLGIIYTMITILAVVSYTSRMNSISTTPVTFGSVLGAIWWQLLMIVLFVVTYVLYNKKILFGVLLEIIMGLAMLIYIVVSVVVVGPNLLAILIELIYPLILVFHGLTQLKTLNNKKKTKTRRSTI